MCPAHLNMFDKIRNMQKLIAVWPALSKRRREILSRTKRQEASILGKKSTYGSTLSRLTRHCIEARADIVIVVCPCKAHNANLIQELVTGAASETRGLQILVLLKMEPESKWTRKENKLFEEALAIYNEGEPDFFHNLARAVGGKTVEEVKEHYQRLVHDLELIESGKIPLPNYKPMEGSS
ncbi:hypothetical protein LguiB_020094 [Lonicera macranthoides]